MSKRSFVWSDDDERERALEALSLARRDHLSLTRAAKLVGLNREEVLSHTRQAWRREGRLWKPTRYDRIPREMRVLTERGPVFVTVRDSRSATRVGAHANAMRAYIERGDIEPLQSFRGRGLTVGGRRYRFVIDPLALDRLGAGGELHYELYRR